MYRRNAFCHSATMYRRETALALGGYPTKYKSAEDYALSFAIAERHPTANIPQILTRCFKLRGVTSASQAFSSIRIPVRHIRPGHIGPAMHSIARISAKLVFHLNTDEAVNQGELPATRCRQIFWPSTVACDHSIFYLWPSEIPANLKPISENTLELNQKTAISFLLFQRSSS